MKLILLLIFLSFLAPNVYSKYYEDPNRVPTINLMESLKVAKEKLKKEKKVEYICKTIKHAYTNGGECWIFTFINKNKGKYTIEVYSGGKTRSGSLLAYPFNKDELEKP